MSRDFVQPQLGDNSRYIYFIHSNYLNNSGPVKEKIDDSKVMNSSVYHFCNLTHNDILLKKWLNNEVVTTN